MEETELMKVTRRAFEMEIKYWEEQDSKTSEHSSREAQQVERTKKALGQLLDIVEQHYARLGLRE